MELGLNNRSALVCASSRGLGKACAISLAREGVAVTLNGRNQEALDAALAEVREVASAPVNAVLADITTEEGRQAVLAACPDPDILVGTCSICATLFAYRAMQVTVAHETRQNNQVGAGTLYFFAERCFKTFAIRIIPMRYNRGGNAGACCSRPELRPPRRTRPSCSCSQQTPVPGLLLRGGIG